MSCKIFQRKHQVLLPWKMKIERVVYGVTQQRKWEISVSQNRFFVRKWCYKAGQERLMLFPVMKSWMKFQSYDKSWFQALRGRDLVTVSFQIQGKWLNIYSSPSAWPMRTEFIISTANKNCCFSKIRFIWKSPPNLCAAQVNIQWISVKDF